MSWRSLSRWLAAQEDEDGGVQRRTMLPCLLQGAAALEIGDLRRRDVDGKQRTEDRQGSGEAELHAAEEARTERLPRGIESGGRHLDPKKRIAMAWDLQKKQWLFQQNLRGKRRRERGEKEEDGDSAHLLVQSAGDGAGIVVWVAGDDEL